MLSPTRRFAKTTRHLPIGVALVAVLLAACVAPPPATNVRMPALFSDHMVVQRNLPVQIWGRADPGGRVRVEMGGGTATAVVAEDSTWSVVLDPLEAPGPYVLTVFAADTLSFDDVLAGEVWVASGQSNMEWSVQNSNDAAEEIAAADYPQIRLFDVEHAARALPQHDVTAEGWHAVTPETIGSFSAVAYYFGRWLHRELGVPIGLISSNWGGTRAEAWTSGPAVAQFEVFRNEVEALRAAGDVDSLLAGMEARYDSALTELLAELEVRDPGLENGAASWAEPDLDETSWSSMTLPQRWEDGGLADYDGVVWFRKEIELPSWLSDRALLARLGRIDDADRTWFNGIEIGMAREPGIDRTYTIPQDITRTGRNTLTVRVLDTGGSGGLVGGGEGFRIENAEPSRAQPVDLSGAWLYRAAVELSDDVLPPRPPRAQDVASVLYNGMIAPLVPYGIRGVIWYQGESNASRAYQYRELFPAMITDWRQNWGQGEFPFYFVQLANFMDPQSDPNENNPWPELREAQGMALALPNTGMAVTIDIGEADDIHPRNKQDVGNRLALHALAHDYGIDVVYSGPTYASRQVVGDSVRIVFDHAGGGLTAPGGPPRGFVIAGSDSQFVWANARIDGSSVVVWSPDVSDPIAVRYAWANNPVATLYNEEGLPAVPFRTDDWPGVTLGVE